MLHFVSGLPRSGSTLLMQVLAQNPNHYVTPTSGLIDVFLTARRNWVNNSAFQSQGLEKIKPRINNVLKGILYNYFENEIQDGKTCFDKNRAWLTHVEDIRRVTGSEPKMICLVRDIRDVVASFEKLYRKRDSDYQYPMDEQYLRIQTTEGRAQYMLAPGGPVGIAVNRVRDAIRRCPDNILLVSYLDLTGNPKSVMNRIHEFCELPDFEYDFDNVKQVTKEDDNYHGYDLHNIREGKILPAEKGTWRNVLPSQLANEIHSQYLDFTKLGR